MQETIKFLNMLADTSGAIARQYFRKPFDVIAKDDDSPVTIADRSIETALRQLIAAHHPDDAVLGEEYGHTPGRSGRTWVIDPIDGTRAFTIGRATFGTLVALCEGDVPVAGLIDQPIVGDRWIGVGGQTTHNNVPVRTRPCADIAGALAAMTSPGQFQSEGERAALDRIMRRFSYPAFGSDCYGYGLLASGYMDAVIEPSLKPHDIMALVPVVTGAGGVMSDWAGKALTLNGGQTQVVACGDAGLHRAVLDICAG